MHNRILLNENIFLYEDSCLKFQFLHGRYYEHKYNPIYIIPKWRRFREFHYLSVLQQNEEKCVSFVFNII